MFRTALAALALGLSLNLPTWAEARGIRVNPVTLPVIALGPETFEVIEAHGAGGTQMWCGAGIYVRQVLGQRRGDIFVQRARGDSHSLPGRKSVVFTLRPVADAFRSLTQWVNRPGKTFSAGHAFALCHQYNAVKLRLQDGRLIRQGL